MINPNWTTREQFEKKIAQLEKENAQLYDDNISLFNDKEKYKEYFHGSLLLYAFLLMWFIALVVGF